MTSNNTNEHSQKDSHLEGLNDRQRDAASYTEGPLLILAGAGAGKTKTITYRILHLIKKGVDPKSILAITFTNKAAKEMKERVEKLLAEDRGLNIPVSLGFTEKPFMSTFHSLGVQIIKENSELLGLPRHFTIFDKADSKRAVKEAIEEAGLDPKQFEPGKIMHAISREKGNLETAETFANKADNQYFPRLVGEVWKRYEVILKKEKALDFDDLLLKTVLLLRQHKNVLERYQNIWKYIHIDEYQDTNKVQYYISKLLAAKERNICVVGDIDQMIYSWRGADIQNILNFEKDYPDARVVLLEQNYRSTQTILTAANRIIEKNKNRRDKKLFTTNGEGERIGVFGAYDEADEADFIAEKAGELIRRGVEPREIAVLYRANFQSRILEEAFLRSDIAYQVLGVRFFERKEVKDVLSYLRAALNPDSTADIKRIINVPARGLGKVTLLKILSGQRDTLPAATKKKVDEFYNILEAIKVKTETEKPSELIKFIIKATGIEASLKGSTNEEDVERLENIKELVTLATKYDDGSEALKGDALRFASLNSGVTSSRLSTSPSKHTGGRGDVSGESASGGRNLTLSKVPSASSEAAPNISPGIEALLTDAALATDQDSLIKNQNAVKLMTVHASKGLEFDYVFISGLEENLFPHKRMGESDGNVDMEEERRLFYVALTRARKRLFLTYAGMRTIFGSKQVNIPSEFMIEMDDDLIQTEDRSGPRRTGFKTIYFD